MTSRLRKAILFANIPMFLVTIYMLIYGLIGLWHPDREWLRPILLLSPLLLAAWLAFALNYVGDKHRAVAIWIAMVPTACIAAYLGLVWS